MQQTLSVFLPGESQGQGSLVGCCLWGRTESDMTEATQQQQQQTLSIYLLIDLRLLKQQLAVMLHPCSFFHLLTFFLSFQVFCSLFLSKTLLKVLEILIKHLEFCFFTLQQLPCKKYIETYIALVISILPQNTLLGLSNGTSFSKSLLKFYMIKVYLI